MKRLIVLLGVAGVSLSAVFVRWSTAPSLILALYRMAFSAALMAVPVLAGRRRELKSLTRRDVLLCLASGLFLGIHFAAYFGALRATSIASAVVLVDTEVFFVAAASALFLGQRLPRRTWPAVLLAFAGSAVVALADSAAGTNALLGDLIALAGAAAMAVYTMIGTVCRQRLSTSVYTFLVYTSAAATLLAAALLSGTPLAGYGPVNGLTALGMAVCCTLLGHNVFSWGLKYLPPAFIATVKLMEPVFASVWGLLLFGERPGWLTVAGGAAVLLGVGLYARTIGGDAGKREERTMREQMLVRIVPMTGDHLDEVAELERICFTTPWSRNMLVEELQNDCAAFLVALDDEDHVAGYAGLLVVLDEGYITNVAVRPECRRNGIAQKLLQVFLDFAQAHKLAFLTLEVRASNYGAIALYGSRGFRSVGRRKNYYEHPKEDAIIMTKEFTDGTEDPDTGAAADGL